jgi:hypothetical protein
MCNDGGALIKHVVNGYELYEIPLYGGEPIFFKTYKTIKEAMNQADKWN